MIADLHCHSRLSDGSLGIDDLLFFAKRAGLGFLALTDHDTMAGVTRAQVLGKRFGLEVLAGVEISAQDPDTGAQVHMLCYMPEKPSRLEGLLRQTLENRTAAGRQMVQRVMRFYPITQEQVAKYHTSSGALYRVHIMQALMDLGYDKEPFGALFEELFGEKGSCGVPFSYPSVDEVLEAIQQAAGIAVFAHPTLYGGLPVCERLAAEGRIGGIECWHPRLSGQESEKLAALCKLHGLVPTGGSDFHGAFRSTPLPLASALTPPESINALYRLKKHRPAHQ